MKPMLMLTCVNPMYSFQVPMLALARGSILMLGGNRLLDKSNFCNVCIKFLPRTQQRNLIKIESYCNEIRSGGGDL